MVDKISRCSVTGKVRHRAFRSGSLSISASNSARRSSERASRVIVLRRTLSLAFCQRAREPGNAARSLIRSRSTCEKSSVEGIGPIVSSMVKQSRPPDTRGYACPVSSFASDRFHRVGVARPQGDPSGITTARRYRVASLIDRRW